MSAGRIVTLLGGAALAMACLRPPNTAAASHTDGSWLQIKSAHFTLVSDLAEPQAARVVAGFEEIYELLGDALLPDTALPDFQTNAVVFAQPSAAREFLGDGFGGVYRSWLPNDLEATPTVIASGTLSPGARLAFAHELVHRFNHSCAAMSTKPSRATSKQSRPTPIAPSTCTACSRRNGPTRNQRISSQARPSPKRSRRWRHWPRAPRSSTWLRPIKS